MLRHQVVEPNYEIMDRICKSAPQTLSSRDHVTRQLLVLTDVELVGVIRVPRSHQKTYEGIPFAVSRYDDVLVIGNQILANRKIAEVDEAARNGN